MSRSEQAEEATRIRAEYERRERDLPRDFYALTREANLFAHHGRERELRALLERAGLLPLHGQTLLEVGCGDGEWFATFERFGAELVKLSGIDLDEGRAQRARRRAPEADVRVGDATQLPWPDGTFDLVFQSTVFSSVLSPGVRALIADEMIRVLKPGGAVLWYDFAYDNPRNPNVRGMKLGELKRLFPRARIVPRRVTLAPPVARRLVPGAWLLAEALQGLRVLNTHLLALIYPHA